VGVRVHLHHMSFPTYLSAVGRHQLKFAFTAWFMDLPEPWNFMETKFHSRFIAPVNSSNDTSYRNPQLDALLDAARAEPDRDRRLAMYRQAEQILFDDAPWIWHYHSMITEVVQPYVKGYIYHPVYMRNYRETWLDVPGTTLVGDARK
jgi:ABC-type transport system substrate-binding protein